MHVSALTEYRELPVRVGFWSSSSHIQCHTHYLDIVPPVLQQSSQASLHSAEELEEQGQLRHTVLIQKTVQAWSVTHRCRLSITFNKASGKRAKTP